MDIIRPTIKDLECFDDLIEEGFNSCETFKSTKQLIKLMTYNDCVIINQKSGNKLIVYKEKNKIFY